VRGNIIFDDRLRERSFGDWEKTNHDAYEKIWTSDINNHTHKEKNVESAKEVLERTGSLIKDLENKYKGENILLVSHGDSIKILQTWFEGISPGMHKGFGINPAEVRELKLK
jgi:probable phosphoglycerate mutase